jgi:23S rRNA (uridine2552-2'-O)-methyltransferase
MMTGMAKSWVRQRKKDDYYRKAKAKGYRSRAAYKLIQINEKFSIITQGDVVVDLGAAPGGWSQVALELVGSEGTVVAVDRKRMTPIEGVHLVRGDLTETETVEMVRKEIGGKADVVLSDMAPRLSGNKHVDHGKSMSLAEAASDFAVQTLERKGNLVVKVFQGDMYPDYVARTSRMFEFSQSHSPKASTASSRENYVVAKGFLG